MKEFTVYVVNEPGSLARVSEILSRNGVNIEGIATEKTDNKGIIKIITSDSNTTKEALERARMSFSVEDVLVVGLINRPGELFKLTREMAKEKINVESIYMISNEKFAIRVDDMGRAKIILKEKLIS